MDDDKIGRAREAESFAAHVSTVLGVIADLLDNADDGVIDLDRGCRALGAPCPVTVEAMVYLMTSMFRSAGWDAARVRERTPAFVAHALTSEYS